MNSDSPNDTPGPPAEPTSAVPAIHRPDGPGSASPQTAGSTHIPRSPRGKVARLPKLSRDKVNFMLRDGVKYKTILARLGDEVKGITPRNVSNWHTSSSYQLWLQGQDWLEDLHADQEPAFDLLNNFDAPKFSQGSLQLAVTRLFLAFRHIDSGDLNHKLGGDAKTFARLVHALARASHETITIEKYREACAKAVAAELKQLNVDRELSDREYELLVKKMDQVFRFARRPPTTPVTTTPPANGSNSALSTPNSALP